MVACSGFCNEPINTKRGLVSEPRGNLKSDDIKDIYPRRLKTEEGYLCPVGSKHNPNTKEKTVNLIRSGGRFRICNRNEWKYVGIMDGVKR